MEYAQKPNIVAIFTLKNFFIVFWQILCIICFLYSSFCYIYCMHIFTTNNFYYSASGHFYYWVLLQFPQILIILNGDAY